MSNIEDHIRKALEEGKFKDLPGKGKPLNLDDNPFEDSDWRMANHMLQNGGFTLPWIEKRAEIVEALAAARQGLRRTWAWRQSAPAKQQPYASTEAEWQKRVEVFREKVTAVNKLIFSYNLEVPAARFQMMVVNIDRELESVMAGLITAEITDGEKRPHGG